MRGKSPNQQTIVLIASFNIGFKDAQRIIDFTGEVFLMGRLRISFCCCLLSKVCEMKGGKRRRGAYFVNMACGKEHE